MTAHVHTFFIHYEPHKRFHQLNHQTFFSPVRRAAGTRYEMLPDGDGEAVCSVWYSACSCACQRYQSGDGDAAPASWRHRKACLAAASGNERWQALKTCAQPPQRPCVSRSHPPFSVLNLWAPLCPYNWDRPLLIRHHRLLISRQQLITGKMVKKRRQNCQNWCNKRNCRTSCQQ